MQSGSSSTECRPGGRDRRGRQGFDRGRDRRGKRLGRSTGAWATGAGAGAGAARAQARAAARAGRRRGPGDRAGALSSASGRACRAGRAQESALPGALRGGAGVAVTGGGATTTGGGAEITGGGGAGVVSVSCANTGAMGRTRAANSAAVAGRSWVRLSVSYRADNEFAAQRARLIV